MPTPTKSRIGSPTSPTSNSRHTDEPPVAGSLTYFAGDSHLVGKLPAMGIVDALVSSTIQVIAVLAGFGLFIGGSQQAAFGSGTLGTIVALVGVILLVFAARM